MRRLARQGILYVDRTPPTPSTSQLHHRLSTSLALPLSAQPSDPQAKQRASSWAALSLAGRSLFAPRDSPPHQSASADSSSVPLPTHEGHAAALITELRLPHPDPHRVWSLFSQLEMAGTTYTLPPSPSIRSSKPSISSPSLAAPSTFTRRQEQRGRMLPKWRL